MLWPIVARLCSHAAGEQRRATIGQSREGPERRGEANQPTDASHSLQGSMNELARAHVYRPRWPGTVKKNVHRNKHKKKAFKAKKNNHRNYTISSIYT